MAVASFAAAMLAVPLVLEQLAAFFYQPRVLAFTHVLTLGWVSMTIQGVLYRYVPGLTKQALPRPRLAVVQGATFALGAAGLVAGFWMHRWWPVVGSAGLLAVSGGLLCANVWPMLLASPQRGVAEIGLLLATAFLVLAAALGMVLGIDKSWAVLPGTVLTNLAAHAHLAALGWVGTTIVALSVRFLPAFLLPAVDVTPIARRLVVALALAVAVLAGLLLRGAHVAWAAAAALATLLLVYVALLLRVVATRRMPMDWTAWHAVASAGWVAAAALMGVVLAVIGGDDVLGARLAAAYGTAGILGWMSNLIIGISYKLFPGFVAAARAQRGCRAVPLAMLGMPSSVQPVVFVVFNVGTLFVVGSCLGGDVLVLRPAGLVLAAGGLLYAAVAARTLSFALRDPRGTAPPLSVLP
ncbi:MAG TPA: hypothetical protein VNO26_06155 [Candidatus Limnocylindria bacterium]|nr:hypothetical protein [Candidatus Limnocylindria bacterium]